MRPSQLLVSFLVGCLLLVSCSRVDIDKSKFEGVDHAVKVIRGTIATGVTYTQMEEYVQRLNDEILMARDNVKTETEKLLLAEYYLVYLEYRVGHVWWRREINCEEHPSKSLCRWYEKEDPKVFKTFEQDFPHIIQLDSPYLTKFIEIKDIRPNSWQKAQNYYEKNIAPIMKK